VSPNYPAQYADQAYCVWYLQSSSQSSITLQFNTFSTEAKVDVVSVSLATTHNEIK
jgi:CUB domain